MKAAETDPRKQAQQLIHDLYNRLIKRENPPETATDITDVLLQVYRKLDNEKNPAALVNSIGWSTTFIVSDLIIKFILIKQKSN
ncbi:bacteriocin immunity protein [Enterococcus malodoratus]|uniref:bacteriocin immunity protein n=1 Tax=Enterococcus malodoratus TaxID=71451 RepID=UPI0030B87152